MLQKTPLNFFAKDTKSEQTQVVASFFFLKFKFKFFKVTDFRLRQNSNWLLIKKKLNLQVIYLFY